MFVPVVKSTPNILSPFAAKRAKPAIIAMILPVIAGLRHSRKGYFVSGLMASMNENFVSIFLAVRKSNTARVTIKAVNKLDPIPMLNVMAKPLTAPDPNCSSTTAAISVVTLESRMALNARLYPPSMHASTDLPLRTSSRMRS